MDEEKSNNKISLFILFYLLVIIMVLYYIIYFDYVNSGVGALMIIILVLPFIISIKKFKPKELDNS